ncbi:AraC family transcriptional regulator [Flavobacterium pectinovorum]|uniref:AraC family transcriptional regulator n=1 Tax=Flavobacterium pectinovorum TaxID=29533 RepID=UPI001FACD03E|nr:AraC family transcriptional regulator [Flavobacterium pectinovorum]MCI9845540.1 helix-turn-helix domain-containing protein [Flavobacterium pectinovorum]
MDNILPRYNINLKNDFVFLEKEDLHQFMHFDLNAHSHNYYILSFLYEGKVAHLSDFKHELVSSPAILMLDIDQVHTHPDMSGCKIVSIAFSTNFISDQQPNFLQKVSKIFSRPFINISSDELNQLDEIIMIMSRECSRVNKDYELIKSLLYVIIVQCNNLSETYPVFEQNKNGCYDIFKLLLKENFMKQHQVKFYADTLNVSTRVLTRLVKSSTFKTPKQLIDDHLLLEAKRLLYWSEASVKEISWQLGFETDSYFNRFFKKHTGKTPKEFHRKHSDDKIE